MTWPNLLSCLRMALIPVFILAVINRMPVAALTIFVVAGITDLLDGVVARYLKQHSALGAYLDPAADKLLMTAAFIILAIPGMWPGLQIPIWISASVITRDVIIVVLVLIIYLALGISKFPPSRLSKWNTAFQISSIILVLMTGIDDRVLPVAWGCLYIMIALTLISGLEYGYRFVLHSDDLPRPEKSQESSEDS